VGRVEDRISDLILARPVFGLEHRLCTEFGRAAVVFLVLLEFRQKYDLSRRVDFEDERSAVVAGGDDGSGRDPGASQQRKMAGLQLEYGGSLRRISDRDGTVVADPGEPVAVRAKADGVDPTAAVKAVGEFGHQLLKRHLGAPRRRARLLLDILDIARENSDFEAGGSGREEAVVGMPIQSRDGGLDGLFDVFRHPPIVFLVEVKDGNHPRAGADGELVLLRRPFHASGGSVDP